MMGKRTMTAVILVVVFLQSALVGCKKADKPAPKSTLAGGEHVEMMVRRSLAEAKKTIAATVNGEPITQLALLREMSIIAPRDTGPDQQPTAEQSAKIRNDALQNLIFRELGVQEARKRGMKVKQETIDAAIKNIVAKEGSPEAYQKYLDDNGLTEPELRIQIEQDALFDLIAAREVSGKIKITEAQLRERYNAGKGELKDSAHKELTFEAAKGMLEQKLRAEAMEKRVRAWEKELKKKAKIEIFEKKRNAER
jgi:hypothetical protein